MCSNLHYGHKTRWILLFLVLLAVAPLRCEADPPVSSTNLMFEFSKPVSDEFWQTVVASMQHNHLSSLFGHPVTLLQRKRDAEASEFEDLVHVKLTGDCASGLNFGANGEGALGWVYLLDGRIQRFVYVDCNRIAHLLRAELRDRPAAGRQRVMACAISYVIFHELLHIATQNPGHLETGVLKPHASRTDLLSRVPEFPMPGYAAAPKSAPCPAEETRQASKFEADFW